MLQEIASTRQDSRPGTRRWFQDADMDLFFWSDAGGKPQRFELSLRCRDAELAVSWTPATGCRAARVDDGSAPGGHARAPLLREAPGGPDQRLMAAFAEHARDMDPAVAAFVTDALRQAAAAAEPAATPAATPATATARAPRFAVVAAVILLILLLLAALGLQ